MGEPLSPMRPLHRQDCRLRSVGFHHWHPTARRATAVLLTEEEAAPSNNDRLAAYEGTSVTDRWDAVAGSYGSSPVVARLAKALVDVVEISPGESVIDVGTGTGLALIPAAMASGAGVAVGVDRSLGMLEVATVRVTDIAVANAALIRADAGHLPVRGASFNVALAASVWQFLGYAREALVEWRRVLRPGGRLGLSVPGPGSGASIPADLTAKYFPSLDRSTQEFFLSRGSPPLPDLAEAAITAGFSEATVASRSWDDTLPGPEDWWAIQWTHAVRFFLQALDPEALSRLKAEALERLVRSNNGGVIVTTKVLYCVARL